MKVRKSPVGRGWLLGLILIIGAMAALSQRGASQSNSDIATVRDAKASCTDRAAAFVKLFNGRWFDQPDEQHQGYALLQNGGHVIFAAFDCIVPFTVQVMDNKPPSSDGHRLTMEEAVAIARALGSARPDLDSALQSACAKAKAGATIADMSVEFAQVDIGRFECTYDLSSAASPSLGWGYVGIALR